jgi:hypothetical protein
VGQLYGLMSVCVSRCVFRFDRWLKLRLHTGHLCGDSSKCRILCTANVRDWQNPLPHSRHLNGFSLECMYLRTWKNANASSVNQVRAISSYRAKTLSSVRIPTRRSCLYGSEGTGRILSDEVLTGGIRPGVRGVWTHFRGGGDEGSSYLARRSLIIN